MKRAGLVSTFRTVYMYSDRQPMVVAASLLLIFIFIVALILHTMQSFKHHLLFGERRRHACGNHLNV